MREAFYSLLVFVTGLVAGRFLPGNSLVHVAPTILLICMTFVVGVELSTDRSYFSEVRRHSFRVLALPILIAIGSLMGAALAATIVRDISLRGALLVSASLGYYSLASVLISTQYSALVGGIALLSNILRELITLLLAPILVRYFGRLSVIAAGAATTMDITLPTIRRVAGPEAVYPALISGVVLTFIVPVLLAVIMKL